MYQDTSRQAYASIVQRINEKQTAVLRALLEGGAMTNKELSRYMEMEINRITPRTGELVAMGFIREKERVPDFETGRRAIRWEADRTDLI